MENDLISRHGVSAWLANMGYSKLADVVMDEDRLPPAQPEKRADKRTGTHACDLIDRQPSSSCSHENDTISRTAAIEAIFGRSHEIIKMRIGNLPSAQPEREKGEWLPQDHNKRTGYVTTTVYYYPKCSECGHTGNYGMNYCPSCGADMRGKQDE